MGYSKYSEDITDRWVEDTRDREDAFFQQWSLEHVPTPPPPSGEVYLEINGRRLEDEEVFPTGTSIRFKAIVATRCAPVEIALRRAGKRSILRPNALGLYTVPASPPSCVEIEAISGAFHRFHIIDFVEDTHIDQIPGVAEEIAEFASNPPGWTREQFENFRRRLRDLLIQSSVPQSFANGLIEYFLAVQLESLGEVGFQPRLEAAFVILRKFAPFSDIAAMITQYFRYRTNTFCEAASATGTRQRPLKMLTDYFVGKISVNAKASVRRREVELVVPEVEYSVMEAVRAMLRDDPSAALGMVMVSRKLQRPLPDPQREDRLKVIEGRAYRALGRRDQALAAYRSLLGSPCQSFQNEASEYLRQ